MEFETLKQESFYLIPETKQIEVGIKQLTKRYSEAREKIVYEVFGYYRIVGDVEPKEFFKSFVQKNAAEKCFERLQTFQMK